MVKQNTMTLGRMKIKPAAEPSRLDRMRAKLGGADSPAASGNAAEGRRVVPLAKVVENEGNERKTFRGMEGITATVEAFGILEPPTVEPRPDGTYLLVTGHRRTRAARSLGHETIEVLVRPGGGAAERRRKSIVSNVQHQDVDAVELAEGLQALLDEDESVTSQADLAAAIGKSRAWVSETLGILRLKPALQLKVRQADRQLPYDAISKIARESPADQETLIGDLLAGAGVTDIRAKIAAKKPVGGKARTRQGGSVTYDVGDGVRVVLHHPGDTPSPAKQADALRAALAQLAAS